MPDEEEIFNEMERLESLRRRRLVKHEAFRRNYGREPVVSEKLDETEHPPLETGGRITGIRGIPSAEAFGGSETAANRAPAKPATAASFSVETQPTSESPKPSSGVKVDGIKEASEHDRLVAKVEMNYSPRGRGGKPAFKEFYKGKATASQFSAWKKGDRGHAGKAFALLETAAGPLPDTNL